MRGRAWWLVVALAGVVPAQAAPAPAPQRSATKPKARIVWTQADLERVRQQPAARITVVDDPSAAATRSPVAGSSAEPVADRYREMLADAEAKIAALQRERLAASNPFLRGLSRNAKGEAVAPRSLDVLDGELARWQERRDAAANLVEQAEARARDREGAPLAAPAAP